MAVDTTKQDTSAGKASARATAPTDIARDIDTTRMSASQRGESHQATVAASVIGLGLVAQNALAQDQDSAAPLDMVLAAVDLPTSTPGDAPAALQAPALTQQVASLAFDGNGAAGDTLATGTDASLTFPSQLGEGLFPFVDSRKQVARDTMAEMAEAERTDTVTNLTPTSPFIGTSAANPAPKNDNTANDTGLLPPETGTTPTAPDQDPDPDPDQTVITQPDLGAGGGLLDPVLGEDGLVGGVIDDLLGNDGLLDNILGEDGLVGGLIDDLLGNDGLLDDLLGDDGLVSGVIDIITGDNGLLAEDGVVVGIIDAVVGENGLVDSILGDDGLVGGVVDIIAGDDGLLSEDGLVGGVIDTVLGDSGVLDGLLGQDGAVGGLVDVVIGPDGLLGDSDLTGGLLGDDGLVGGVVDIVAGDDGLLSEDGLVGGVIDTVLGDSGVLNGLLGQDSQDGLLSGDGVVGSLLGNNGLLGGVGGLFGALSGNGGQLTADLPQPPEAQETPTEESTPVLAALEPVNDILADTVETVSDLLSGDDDGFLDSLLATDSGNALFDGLLGDDDIFNVTPLASQEASEFDLFAGLTGIEELSGSIVDQGLLTDPLNSIVDDTGVDDLLNQILGTAVGGDALGGADNIFAELLGETDLASDDDLLTDIDTVIGTDAIESAVTTVLDGVNDLQNSLLGGLFGSASDDLDS